MFEQTYCMAICLQYSVHESTSDQKLLMVLPHHTQTHLNPVASPLFFEP
jgi:hypothetical protein